MKKIRSNTKIIEYIKGELDPLEEQKLEESMSVSDFENDALEGLIQIKDKQNVEKIIKELDQHLKKEIKKNKKRKFNSNELFLITLISLITILLTILMAFYIYKMMKPA